MGFTGYLDTAGCSVSKRASEILEVDVERLSQSGIGYIAVHPEWLRPQTIEELKKCSNLRLVSDQRKRTMCCSLRSHPRTNQSDVVLANCIYFINRMREHLVR